MTFLAPHFLWIGLGLAAAVVAIHFIVTRQPRSEAFPTARFVPESPVEAVSRATRPSDILLLLLRVLAVLSLAAAFARPIIAPNRDQTARIILADASASSKTITDIRDSSLKYFRPNDLVIAFDSSVRVILHPDSLPRTGASPVGSLSPALIAALRSARDLRERADSISLIIVSALPLASWDAATDTIRALWPGAITVVRVAPNADTAQSAPAPVAMDFRASDPLRYSAVIAARLSRASSVRIVREGEVPLAMIGNGVMIHWPSASRPLFASPAAASNQGGIVVDGKVVFGAFRSEWTFTADSLRGARVIARWIDGSPAAVQRDFSGGCARSVNISVPERGDLVIRPEFISVVQRFMAPCEGILRADPLPDSLQLRLKGGTAAAARSAFRAPDDQYSPFTFLLILGAALLLGAEQILRRSRGSIITAVEHKLRAAA